MTIDRKESPADAIKEPIFLRAKALLEADAMAHFQKNPGKRADALQRLSPDTFGVHVYKHPVFSNTGAPIISVGIKETAPGKQDGIAFQIRSDTERDALWNDVTPADFKVLAEECAMESFDELERKLRETSAAELDKNYNGHHTYRSLYTMQLRWARETLAWARDTDATDIKQLIQYM